MPIFVSMFLTLLFSIGSGQTAHLNVLAVPTPPATAATLAAPALTKKGICDITLTFFDGQSNQLKTNEVWINPGSSSSLSMSWPFGQKFIRGSTFLYGEVMLMADSDASCQISPSMEITQDLDGSVEVLLPLQTLLASAVASGG
ncbi:MAG: hypothetical protein ACLQU2_12070 [Candidatus Binataceae bacterium]